MSEIKSQIKSIPFKSVDEVLDFAINSEVNAKRFYGEWAKKVEKGYMVKVFEELAEEEGKHEEFLLDVKKGKAFKPALEAVENLKISDYMLDVKASADMNYQDALVVAMHREKMAFKLYSSLVDMVDGQGMKDTFSMLAQQEAKHKLRLEMIYDEEILTEN